MNGLTRTKSVSEFNGFMVQTRPLGRATHEWILRGKNVSDFNGFTVQADLSAVQHMNEFMKSVFEFNEVSICVKSAIKSAKK